MLKFSVVIPIYNEEESVIRLYSSLKDVMDRIGQSYEIIFVNDGSKDKSFEVLNSIDPKPASLVIVNLKKRCGQSTALQTGFDIACGELIITMDGDLQNDPEDIPKLLDKMKRGYDIVSGWRYDRKDPRRKILASKIANITRRIIVKEKIHDVGCTFRIFKRRVLRDVYLSNGLHRFFTLIMARKGYNITETIINHRPRKFGRAKYNICDRLFKGLIDFTRILLLDMHSLVRRKPNYKISDVIRK